MSRVAYARAMTDARAARPGRPLGRPPRLRWSEILDAVDQLGYDAFTVTAVAERLGVRDSTLYNYIDGRDQLRAAACHRALGEVRLRHDAATGWVDYLVRVDLSLREVAARRPGLADYYRYGPYLDGGLAVFETQIAELRRRLPGADDDYAFLLASHASSTTLSFLASPAVGDDVIRRVLTHTLPALHEALGGHAPTGVSWRRLRDELRAGAVPVPRAAR